MIKPEQLEVLADIFGNTERPDKITVELNQSTRSLTVHYDDLDEEWFRDMAVAMWGSPCRPTCSTCSCQTIEPGNVKIHDLAKWCASPIPCPECEQRSKAAFANLGRKMAERLDARILAIVADENDDCPKPGSVAP